MSLRGTRAHIDGQYFSQIVTALEGDMRKKNMTQDLRLAKRGENDFELKIHEKSLGDFVSSGSRDTNRQEASRAVENALINQVGKSTAARLMAQADIRSGAPQITVEQVMRLDTRLKFHLAEHVETAKQSWARAQPVPIRAAAVNPGVEQLLADPRAAWKEAGSGAGAAVIVRSDTEPSGGALLKFDTLNKAKASQQVATLAQDVAFHCEGGMPLEFAAVEIVSGVDAPARAALAQKFQEVRIASGDDRMDAHVQRAGQLVPGGNPAEVLSKMSLAQGTQIDKLPLEDRINLYKSPEFARQIGQATVLCPMFGLNDHVAPRPTIGGAEEGMNYEMSMLNLGNMMINKQTGGLVAIDYSTGVMGASTTGNTIPGFKGLDVAMEATTHFMERSLGSQDSFDKAVQRLQTDAADISTNDGVTPLSATYAMMTAPQEKEGLFNVREASLLPGYITDADKAEFAKNMLRGVNDGLQFVQQHQQQFANAYNNASARLIEEGTLAPGEEAFGNTKQLANIAETLNPERMEYLQTQMQELNPARVTIGAARRASVGEDLGGLNREDMRERLEHLIAAGPPKGSTLAAVSGSGSSLQSAKPPGGGSRKGVGLND